MNLLLIGAIDPKHVSWLTPLWLLGVGGVATLVLLAVLGLFFAGLSRIRALGELTEDRTRFRKVSLALAAVVFLGLAGWASVEVMGAFQRGGSEEGLPLLLRMLALAVPAMLGVWGAVAALLSLASRRLVSEIEEAVMEGILLPVLVAVVVLAAIGVAGTFTLRSPLSSWGILKSLTRVASVGTTTVVQQIPASTDPEVLDGLREPPIHEIKVAFRGDELRALEIEANQDVSVVRDKETSMDSPESLEVLADEPFRWQRRGFGTELFGREPVNRLYVRNRSAEDARVAVTYTTDIVYPQALTVPIFAFSVAFFVAAYLSLRTIAPRVSAIALATFNSETAQPIFLCAVILTAIVRVL